METITTIEPKQKVYFDLTTSPHLHSKWSTSKVMWFVVAALAKTAANKNSDNPNKIPTANLKDLIFPNI